MAGGQCIPPTLMGVSGGGRVELAEQPQPGQPTVRVHVVAQVRGRGRAVEQQAVPGVGLNRGGRISCQAARSSGWDFRASTVRGLTHPGALPT